MTGGGDRVGLLGRRRIGVPIGYVSGDPLSGTATYTGNFDSIGVATGTFTTSLVRGAVTETIVVNVAGVPEPSSATVIGLGMVVLIGRRRRKRIGT